MSIVFLFQVDIISGTKKPAEEEAKKRKSRFDQAIPVAGVTVMKNSVPPPTLTSVPSGNKTTISAFGSLKKTKQLYLFFSCDLNLEINLKLKKKIARLVVSFICFFTLMHLQPFYEREEVHISAKRSINARFLCDIRS